MKKGKILSMRLDKATTNKFKNFDQILKARC